MKIEQFKNKNQFIIKDNETIYFQSYDVIIAKYNKKDGLILDNYYWDYSKTTLKHLYMFIDEFCDFETYEMMYKITNNKRASLQTMIDLKELKTANLN